MQNNEWWVSYPYCISCPNYGYEGPMYPNLYRSDGDSFDDLEDFFEDESFGNLFSEEDYFDEVKEEIEEKIENEFEDMRTPQDVDRVIRIINQRAAREINEIVRMGMDRRLLDYLIRTMVSYIDRNYNRYRGTKQQKIDMATRDIRRDFPWIFGIMNLYRISPATQARLLQIVVTTSIESLRMPPSPPAPPKPPVPPMPR